MCTVSKKTRARPPVQLFSANVRVSIKDLGNYDEFVDELPRQSDDDCYWNVVKWVKVDGTEYRPGMVVIVGLGELYPRFGSIEIISVTQSRVSSLVENRASKAARFLVKELITVRFNAHVHAYQVEINPSRNCWLYVKQKGMVTHVPAHKRLSADGNWYVMTRHAL